MRQLNTEGYQHNRGRLITSAILIKILHCDWTEILHLLFCEQHSESKCKQKTKKAEFLSNHDVIFRAN